MSSSLDRNSFSTTFSQAKVPPMRLGSGAASHLNDVIPAEHRVLLITGGSEEKPAPYLPYIFKSVDFTLWDVHKISVSGEPSPSQIDALCNEFKDAGIQHVVSVGGGSVIDTGKAVSAMLTQRRGVKNFLEGVGHDVYNGQKIHFVALPTTSGPGSECTKNAVLTEIGERGFKKSLRHDTLISDLVILDPNLMISCPSSVTAACGLDAFTQCMEPYLSPQASPFTDALALEGMRLIAGNLSKACNEASQDIECRSNLALGSFFSGVSLANAGLGIVHGLASPLGAHFRIPHGVVCGTLLATAAKINFNAMLKVSNRHPGILKMATIAHAILLENRPRHSATENIWAEALLEYLNVWTKNLSIPTLGQFGITEEHFDQIVEESNNRNNPVTLSKHEVRDLLYQRL